MTVPGRDYAIQLFPSAFSNLSNIYFFLSNLPPFAYLYVLKGFTFLNLSAADIDELLQLPNRLQI